MRVLDLFSGIGGFSLGLERAGMKTVAFCEIEPFCRAVLRKHWPDVPIYEDVRTLTAERLCADGIIPDLICGGFPCQDISSAGKGAGIEGARSGLWREYARLIGELRPHYVIVENVSALRSRGLGRVLGDLAALGFDAEWHCIPASAIGACHQRDRIWIIAHLDGEGKRQPEGRQQNERRWACNGVAQARHTDGAGSPLAQADQNRRPLLSASSIERTDWWAAEPDVVRMVHGLSGRVERIKALGNAVVPQIPELIGRAIMRTAA